MSETEAYIALINKFRSPKSEGKYTRHVVKELLAEASDTNAIEWAVLSLLGRN